MDYSLLSKAECDAIVESSEAFYRADRVVEGQNVAIYDYRLASASDFFPEEGPNRTEMRGLCFVEQENGTWQRNILMQKFFNIGQTEGANNSLSWMYEDVQHKKIVSLSNKEDGSIISFVKFANGRIRAKSKASFESDQAKMAQKLFDNSVDCEGSLYELVTNHLAIGLVPIFELVSPMNQIVLEYQNTELILLQVRCSVTGDYKKHLHTVGKSYGVKYAKNFELMGDHVKGLPHLTTLDALLELKETDQRDIEGWIITFEDGQMAKIKTKHYMELHGLIGPDAFRENLLIQSIIGGNIDDVISALASGEKKDKIVKMEELVSHKYNHLVLEWKELRNIFYNQCNSDRKTFAIKYSENPLFGSVIKNINGSFRDVESIAEKAVEEYILKRTSALGKAKEWIKSL